MNTSESVVLEACEKSSPNNDDIINVYAIQEHVFSRNFKSGFFNSIL